MNTITFTKEQALKFTNQNNSTRPIRIKNTLEKMGFSKVEIVGRGKNLIFKCYKSNSTNEQYYYMFKDICINEYGYSSKLNYDKVLLIIDYHINNKLFKSLEDIAKDLNISIRTLSRHRDRLCGNILKHKEHCKVKTYAHHIDSNVIKEITELYNDTIKVAYGTQIQYLKENFKVSTKTYVSIFTNKKLKSFKLIQTDSDNIDFIRESLNITGNKLIGTYPLYWSVEKDKEEINPHLAQKIFQLILTEHGFDYVFFLYLYELMDDLKYDGELLEIIKGAILHMKEK